MSQEIEIEYKVLLTKQEYTRLLKALPFNNESLKQTNYYFETSPLSLKDKGCALRIREKNNTFCLTLKEPHSEGILETHDELTEKEACSWLANNINKNKHTIQRLIAKGVNVESLNYYGKLITERRQFQQEDIVYVLDYSTYNGYSDYELEIEAPNKEVGITAFQKIITDYSIIGKKTPNKIARFFQTYKKDK
ncbi:CYTH domain-containing protein [Virgibacillus sp. W0430]|uniref:CYTH domain-containing protein n=1 Tax=Virgibacillus sp. W0430 TaxID=3391580 RepID=UPI003F46FC34